MNLSNIGWELNFHKHSYKARFIVIAPQYFIRILEPYLKFVTFVFKFMKEQMKTIYFQMELLSTD